MSLPDRATIANMAPEYGATIGFFPVDQVTLDYMHLTGRTEAEIELVEKYYKAQGMFWTKDTPDPEFTDTMELDMGTVEPSLAGPKRPQDRILLSDMKSEWETGLTSTFSSKGVDVENVDVTMDGQTFNLKTGAVVIAALTSCTNTSNPDVMIAAGLVARKARALGLTSKPWVKTSLAPGSKVVTEYYNKANLTEDLNALGFNNVGYGCTTCIGNSGPLRDEIEEAIPANSLVVASVLSGNRNFEGRIHQQIKANYLASPPLVVAYAIAGTVDIDLTNDPIAQDKDGNDVFLRDIWPTHDEVLSLKAKCLSREQFVEQYANVYEGNETWNEVPVSKSDLYAWDESSTYIQNPPYFDGMTEAPPGVAPIRGARCLIKAGDSVTTDHISPAGAIAKDSPAGEYLVENGVPISMFNSYGSRRGNDRVMTRGTFANIRVKNQLTAEPFGSMDNIKEGWWTRDFSSAGGGSVATTYAASLNYKNDGTPLVVLGGKDYGMGSSRDWAAKGTILLGVRAVITESFERIHRSNLVGMGVLPLCYAKGASAQSLGLDGSETFDIDMPGTISPGITVSVTATKSDGTKVTFETLCRLDTPVEVTYYENGGVLQTVLRRILNESRQPANA